MHEDLTLGQEGESFLLGDHRGIRLLPGAVDVGEVEAAEHLDGVVEVQQVLQLGQSLLLQQHWLATRSGLEVEQRTGGVEGEQGRLPLPQPGWMRIDDAHTAIDCGDFLPGLDGLRCGEARLVDGDLVTTAGLGEDRGQWVDARPSCGRHIDDPEGWVAHLVGDPAGTDLSRTAGVALPGAVCEGRRLNEPKLAQVE